MQDRQTKGEREDEFEKGDYGSKKQGGIRYIQQRKLQLEGRRVYRSRRP